MWKFIGAALAIALGGCATVQNSLSVAEVASLRIEQVEISYSPEAHIWWGRAEREYAETAQAASATKPKKVRVNSDDAGAAASEHAKLVESPEAKAAIRQRLSAMVKQGLEREVLPKYRGTRSAQLEVKIVSFVIPSAAQRIVFGGTPMLGAVTVLKDAKTGAILASSDRLAAGPAGNGLIGVAVDQGFSDLEDRVLNAYVANVNAWLSKS
jgi:hypothetical protein